MQTRYFGTKTEDIISAADIIKEGGLVAFPTETVYGLGADALNPDAVGKVYAAKGRPSDNPMIVHIAEKDELSKLTNRVTEDIKILEEIFWPGPLTIVVPALPIVPRVTTGGLDTVAVRMPSDEVARELIRQSECPIAAPSANLSGKPSPTTSKHVIDDLEGRIDAIIMGNNCQVGIESTVIDMTGDVPTILRPGLITKEMVEAALSKEVKFDPALLARPEIDEKGNMKASSDFKPKSPGMKYKHYAPKAEMIIFRGDKDKVADMMIEYRENALKSGQKVEVIIFDDEHPEEAAKMLFYRLRECDKLNVDLILAEALPEEGVGFSVMNRMFKSAGYHIIDC